MNAKNNMRAQEGEDVLLIINYVKNEFKAHYEKFMHEVFFDILLKSDNPNMQNQFSKTRWLTPKGQNKNTTWTYAFFMDPIVQGGDYNILNLLKLRYPEEVANKLMQQYISFMAANPYVQVLVQSKF